MKEAIIEREYYNVYCYNGRVERFERHAFDVIEDYSMEFGTSQEIYREFVSAATEFTKKIKSYHRKTKFTLRYKVYNSRGYSREKINDIRKFNCRNPNYASSTIMKRNSIESVVFLGYVLPPPNVPSKDSCLYMIITMK